MLNNLICISLVCARIATINLTHYEDVEKQIEFNFPVLIAIYKTGILSQIEAFKSTLNDKILHESDNDVLKYRQLNWYSIGFPVFVPVSEKLFTFTPEGFYAHVNMLTNSHRLMFKEMIKRKYNIEVSNNQIGNIPLELFECSIFLFDESTNAKYLINGQVKDFRQFPLKLQFDFSINTKERGIFEKRFSNQSTDLEPFGMSFECKIASKGRKYEQNILKINLDQLFILNKLFGESTEDTIFVNHEQMIRLASDLYTQLDIMCEYQMSEYQFSTIFIQDFIRQTSTGFFEFVPFNEALRSLSQYGFTDNFAENLLNKLFTINVINEQEQIVINLEHLSKFDNEGTGIGESSDFKFFRVKATYNHVKERIDDWIKSKLNLNDQLKEMNEYTDSDIMWHCNGTQIEPKSLKVARLNRDAFNKTLIFNRIRRVSIESPFQTNIVLNTINNILFLDTS